MTYNLHAVPFSRMGSYLSISYIHLNRPNFEPGAYLRTVRNGDETPYQGALLRIQMLDSENQAFDPVATLEPSKLTLSISTTKFAEVCFQSNDVIRFRLHNTSLRCTFVVSGYDTARKCLSNCADMNSYTQQTRLLLNVKDGEMRLHADWENDRSTAVIVDIHPATGASDGEFSIVNYQTAPPLVDMSMDFDSCALSVQDEFGEWLRTTLTVDEQFDEARMMAAYITWSSIVLPEGILTRPAMYMSKNWMTNIWSWDHCFNAMALIKTNPSLAWDQFMIPFDHQDISGQLPDFVNNRFALWNSCKPPIHGWALNWMLERSDFIDRVRLSEIYAPLKRWTDWWFHFHDDNSNGIPAYNHGNESGWDNATIFSTGIPVESPDLAAFLVIQLEVLSDIASRLSLPDEATDWSNRAQQLLERALNYFWDGASLVAKRVFYDDKEQRYMEKDIHAGDSLILFIPLLLGKRLPPHIRTKMLEALQIPRRFLSPHGIATESLASAFYQPDGYWRGPIWAPTTLIFVDALKSLNAHHLSRELALKFCRLTSTSGMAENFDAITGEGLRDKAFTWTSSVFLILANEYIS